MRPDPGRTARGALPAPRRGSGTVGPGAAPGRGSDRCAMGSPQRTVIATMGDGATIFCNPSACHQVAAAYGLPVLTIVCNNGK